MRRYAWIAIACVCLAAAGAPRAGADPASGPTKARVPITVNGDTVEFLAEGREVTAEGNVEIDYQGNTLRCDRVHVYMDQKLAVAEGSVVFASPGGQEMRGEMLIYDFGDGTGTIIQPAVDFAPYYCGASLMEKVAETEYLVEHARLSTCDLPHQHWGLSCREVDVDGNILQAKDTVIRLGDVPVMYLPFFSKELTDKKPRLMITPGHNKDFGTELFGSWRYYLNAHARGVAHIDWYQNRGFAEGIDLNYDTRLFGRGQAKYYRIDEEDPREEIPQALRDRDERSRLELRHRWEPSPSDQMVLEYFRASDAAFRQDYFYREYEKDPAPRSYFLYSHVFPQATLSLLGEPRVNSFETKLQRIPEVKLETVNHKVFDNLSLYYKNLTTATYLSSATASSGATTDVMRADTSQQISYPFRFMSLDVNPFVGHRDTYYSRGVKPDETLLRGAFFAGIDVSTRLYRVFDVTTRAWGLDINRLRHVVTPQIQYRYQHAPTVDNSRLYQLDPVDTLDRNDALTFILENKLQTKRSDDQVADLATLILSADYYLEPNDTFRTGFATMTYDLEFKPYKEWEFDSDAAFDVHGGFFRTLNADLWGHFGRAGVTTGYRFKKDESSQVTAGLTWKLNPFWNMGIYERFECKTGDLVEQEYRLSRDMHCWLMDFIVNNRASEGMTFMLGFTLKAFPSLGIEAQKTFRPPEHGI
ncbi:MAG: LPS-assembly protein LptD [Deltaproteobacteria bacterium]